MAARAAADAPNHPARLSVHGAALYRAGRFADSVTLLDEAIRAALAHIEDIVHGRVQQAMNALHSHASS